MPRNADAPRASLIGGPLTPALLLTLAALNAVPPMATDMYSAAFPQITASLSTTSTMVGLTLTAFFIGYAAGQVLGGAVSDQLGRRGPVVVGCLAALAGSLVCVFAPNAGVLIAGRVLQGFGGGVASSVGRAVLVDVAHGRMLARAMSLLQAVVGFAPMVAPVLGGFIVTRAPGGPCSGRSRPSPC